jgi:hypothetical protein
MASTIKVKILTNCDYCQGKAYLPVSETVDTKGEFYTQYKPCPHCEGSGHQEKYISLVEFVRLIETVDIFEPDYEALAESEPVTQYVDSLEAAGIR